jgi:hypothetical protein
MQREFYEKGITFVLTAPRMKRINLLFLVIFSSFLAMCGSSTKEHSATKIKPDTLISASPIQVHDTLFINEKCAILLWPDSIKIDRMKKESENEEDFYTAADDNMFYIAQTRTYLDSNKIKNIDTEKEIICFTKENHARFIGNYTGEDYAWSLIIFNGKDDPIVDDIVTPDTLKLLELKK